MTDYSKVAIPKSLKDNQGQTQTETLQVPSKKGQLVIGIPKEEGKTENRVTLVPASVATLVANGHKVLIESGAGLKSNYVDRKFSDAGAQIAYSKQEVYKADIILKVAPPTIEELDHFHHNQVLISPLQLPLIKLGYLEKLKEKKVIALAMEYIQDEYGVFPIVRTMSEMAGNTAIITAAELLSKKNGGRGVLLGGVSGVPPSKVVILGGGVVAEFAARVAIGLGAEIRVFDNNVYKLMRLQQVVGRQLNTSTLNPLQLEKELVTAEVVIGAIHSSTGRAPMIVTEDMVMKMKKGAVIVDVSIDQGGCFETSEVTTHDNPTFVKHGVIHYCVPNIASKIPRTASIAVSNILLPMLLKASTTGGIIAAIFNQVGLRKGVYAYKGCLTNEYLSKKFGMKHTDIDLLLTSST